MKKRNKIILTTMFLWVVSVAILGLTHYQYFDQYALASAVLTAVGVWYQDKLLHEQEGKSK